MHYSHYSHDYIINITDKILTHNENKFMYTFHVVLMVLQALIISDYYFVTQAKAVDDIATAILYSPWTAINTTHCLLFYYFTRGIDIGEHNVVKKS